MLEACLFERERASTSKLDYNVSTVHDNLDRAKLSKVRSIGICYKRGSWVGT